MKSRTLPEISIAFVLLATAIAPWQRPLQAVGPPLQAKSRGTYHVDRWGQHRFGLMFVDPALHEKLAPSAGAPITLGLGDSFQQHYPGTGILTRISTVEPIKPPVEIAVEWIDEKGKAVSGLHTTSAGGSAKCRITLKNKMGRTFPEEEQQICLEFRAHVPSTTKIPKVYDTDPLEYWSQHQSASMEFLSAKAPDKLITRHLSVIDAIHLLEGKDQTINVLDAHWRDFTVTRSREIPKLAEGESCSWNVELTNLPANEYELAVSFKPSVPDTRAVERIQVYSKSLRLDALEKKPQLCRGLVIELQCDATSRRTDEGMPAFILIKNLGASPVYFGLDKREKGIDLSQSLLCYDKSGGLIPTKFPPRGGEVEWVTLQPGKELEVNTMLPPNTRRARVAWYHAYIPPIEKRKEGLLGNGYIFSQHLTIAE